MARKVSELTCGEGCVECVAASHQAGGGLSRALQQQNREHGVLKWKVGGWLFPVSSYLCQTTDVNNWVRCK
jgi:hypothetical protein